MTQTPDPNAMPDPYQSPTPAGPPPDPMGYNQPPTGPMGYAPPPVPPKKKTNWLAIAVLIGIVVVIGGGLYLFRDRLGSNVTDLAVGDCFAETAADETITDVQHQPCNTPHDREVIALLTHPAAAGEAYPVVSGFSDYVEENCIPTFESYTGRDFDTETELKVGWFEPTLLGWGEGDRGFTCFVSREDGQPLNATVRNIGTSPLP